MHESAFLETRAVTLLPFDDDEHDCVFCGAGLRDEVEMLNDTCHKCAVKQDLCVKLEGFTDLDYVCTALLNYLPTLTKYVPTNERKLFERLTENLQTAIQKTRH